MNFALKNCPFCGEPEDGGYGVRMREDYYSGQDQVLCQACGARVQSDDDTEDNAREKWNRRLSTLTDTLTNNPALMDELTIDLAILMAQVIKTSPRIAHPGENRAFYDLILAWAARVEAEIASDSEKRPNEAQDGHESPDFSL